MVGICLENSDTSQGVRPFDSTTFRQFGGYNVIHNVQIRFVDWIFCFRI